MPDSIFEDSDNIRNLYATFSVVLLENAIKKAPREKCFFYCSNPIVIVSDLQQPMLYLLRFLQIS